MAVRQTRPRNEPDRRRAFRQLRRVIAWEMGAQAGANQALEAMPRLVNDSVLDYFDVTPKPGVDLSNLL